MTAVFVDTNVLIYSEDGASAEKQARANAWLSVLWQRRLGRVSTQVLNEFYAKVTQQVQPPMPAGDARAEVRRYQHWKPWLIDHATVETGWAIESRFGLAYRDALIVSAAKHQRCRYVLSEDMPQDQLIDGVMIVNPFLIGPELLDAPLPAWAKDLA